MGARISKYNARVAEDVSGARGKKIKLVQKLILTNSKKSSLEKLLMFVGEVCMFIDVVKL